MQIEVSAITTKTIARRKSFLTVIGQSARDTGNQFLQDRHSFLGTCFSSWRTQRVLSLSSAESEIYAGTSASCDGLLFLYCVEFSLNCEAVDYTLSLDKTAAKAFFLHRGVGRIRHVSVMVLWLQQKTREGTLKLSKVPTEQNHLGTKRLAKDRMLFLLNMCKAFDRSSSTHIGSDVCRCTDEGETMKSGISRLRMLGGSKAFFRILLLGILSLPNASFYDCDASCNLQLVCHCYDDHGARPCLLHFILPGSPVKVFRNEC